TSALAPGEPSPMINGPTIVALKMDLLRTKVPALTIVVPVKLLAELPDNVSVPGRFLVMPPGPLIAPDKVKELAAGTRTLSPVFRTTFPVQVAAAPLRTCRVELEELRYSVSFAIVTPSRSKAPLPVSTVPLTLDPKAVGLLTCRTPL